MAARRKVPRSEPTGARAFAVVLEKVHADFQVFGEALTGLREHMDRRFDVVDRRFEQVDRRFDRVEHETELLKAAVLEHGRELKEHGRELREHGRELKEHGRELKEHGRELKELRVAVTDLAARKVDRDEVEGIAEHVLARTHP
jgi:hypothetical protein